MVTLEKVYERVIAALPEGADHELAKLAVRTTLAVCDLHVNERTGEIYSPLPKPVTIFPQQQRWRARRRR